MTQADEIAIAQLDVAGAAAAIPELAGILADAVESGASVGFMAGTAIAEYERFWQGVAAEVGAGRTILFVAMRDGRIVGTSQLQLIGKPNQPHRAEIAKVLVHSAARRRGIAERLMHAAETEAARRGRNLLVLDTDDASAAHALYGKLGWIAAGTIPRYALMPDGSDCNATFFYKSLR
ncbi:GNAT family N-acetyltransferase [Bosea sp. PAMC 26642]|uniref:GNAT family N-acetyltransferase n=1 Tax=Bosea sp. (strain PAMC 26642) TaxID=1792307 RepID=UPI0007704B2B|nr:GNAT family N-acetyltransferase [Bosea sp. PAMC 26642]AMJ59141.1 GCN5 family acetyltransferase [Bosea sp. PAMC 26642]